MLRSGAGFACEFASTAWCAAAAEHTPKPPVCPAACACPQTVSNDPHRALNIARKSQIKQDMARKSHERTEIHSPASGNGSPSHAKH